MFLDALWRLDRFTKLFTMVVHLQEDPHDYWDSFHKVLQNMGIVETNGVHFTAFRLSSSAKKWWRDFCLARPAGFPAFTCDQFSQLFLEKFLHITRIEDYRRQFEHRQ